AARVAGASVTFTVTGTNPTNDTETTDTNGVASFSYTGTVPGDDTIGAQAVVLSGTDVVAQGDATPVTKTWTSGLSVSKTASGVRSVATTYTWSVSKTTSSSPSRRPTRGATRITWTSSPRRPARCSPPRMPRFPSSRTRRRPAQRRTSRTRRRVLRSSRAAIQRTFLRARTSLPPRRARHSERRPVRLRSPTRD